AAAHARAERGSGDPGRWASGRRGSFFGIVALGSSAPGVFRGGGRLGRQVLSPKSRSALFSDVLRSVDAVRIPTINAQPTWNSPAGNCLGRVPGTTTERAGTRP